MRLPVLGKRHNTGQARITFGNDGPAASQMETPKQTMLATALNCSMPFATPQTTAGAKAPNENLRSAINDKITAAQNRTKGEKFRYWQTSPMSSISGPCTPNHPLAFNSALRRELGDGLWPYPFSSQKEKG